MNASFRLACLFVLVLIGFAKPIAAINYWENGQLWQDHCPRCSSPPYKQRAQFQQFQGQTFPNQFQTPSFQGQPQACMNCSPVGAVIPIQGPEGRTTAVDGVPVPEGTTAWRWKNGKPDWRDAKGGWSSEIASSTPNPSNGVGASAGLSENSAHGTEGDLNSAARGTASEGGLCRQQAKALPFKMENGKLTLDPKDESVKKFMAANAPQAIGEVLASMLPGEKLSEKLDKLVDKNNASLRQEMTDLLKSFPTDKRAADYVTALNRLFGLERPVIKWNSATKGNLEPGFYMDYEEFKKLGSSLQEEIRHIAKDTKYIKELFETEKDGNFCFGCKAHEMIANNEPEPNNNKNSGPKKGEKFAQR